MLKKIENKNIIKAIILLFTFFIIFILDTLVFVTPLDNNEYQKIQGLYQEMRRIDISIKSNFYCEKGLKYLDRSYILEELVSDSLKYSLTVSENAFSQIKDGESYTKVIEYLNRCDLDFENYRGLEQSAKVFSLNTEYFVNFTDNPEKLEYYSEDLNNILKETDELFNKVSEKRWSILMFYSLSYLICLVIFIKIEDIYKFILYGVKK